MSTVLIYAAGSTLFSALAWFFTSKQEKQLEETVTWFGAIMKVSHGLGIDLPKVFSGLSDMLKLAGVKK